MRVLGDAEEAADPGPGRLRGASRQAPSYRGESRFTTWLYRVVVNAARDALRRKAVRQRGERSYAEFDALVRAEDTARTSLLLWLRSALDGLPDELRIHR